MKCVQALPGPSKIGDGAHIPGDKRTYIKIRHSNILFKQQIQEARKAAAKEAAKRAKEQVKELKRIRGEKWLPSIARDMKLVSRGN